MRTGLQTHLSDLKLEEFARSLYWNLRLLPRALTSADRRLMRAYFRSHTKRKLHVGCGDHTLDGWLDADLYPTSTRILRLDANQTYPLSSNLFDYAFSEHLITTAADGPCPAASAISTPQHSSRLSLAGIGNTS